MAPPTRRPLRLFVLRHPERLADPHNRIGRQRPGQRKPPMKKPLVVHTIHSCTAGPLDQVFVKFTDPHSRERKIELGPVEALALYRLLGAVIQEGELAGPECEATVRAKYQHVFDFL